jgi:hypothetical protein
MEALTGHRAPTKPVWPAQGNADTDFARGQGRTEADWQKNRNHFARDEYLV